MMKTGNRLTITVTDQETEYAIQCEEGQNILSALTCQKPGFSAPCGGNGICGKCRICLMDGFLAVSSQDKIIFTQNELEEGYRLACTAFPTSNCAVRLCMDKEEKIEVVTDNSRESEWKKDLRCSTKMAGDEYGIAVDLGTTTIAMQLIQKENKEVIGTHTALNPQRSSGADVLSRIQASCAGKKEVLQLQVRNALKDGIKILAQNCGITLDKIREIVIAANTTMVHLLMGYPCDSLGVAPFIPHSVEAALLDGKSIFPDMDEGCKVKIVPGISAFVGGDIVAGLYACGMMHSECVNLFLDLGTNGEMVLGNRENILVTSAAAGPAFEGGNISCGIGSIKGAISKVKLTDHHRAVVETIGKKPPIGICGTGVIEAISEMVQNGLIDKTGLLEKQYFDSGFFLAENEQHRPVVLTQRDIREIQMAKAAIRAGIEVLMSKYGADCERIDTVYLAGGFGYYADVEKMALIGMIPDALKEKTIAVGNTSLLGARSLLFEEADWNQLEIIRSRAEEISLALDHEFQMQYMKHINF